MQIPPATALFNLLSALPAQGVSAAPSVAKGPQSAAAAQPTAAMAAPATVADGRQPTALLPRGSIVNILA
jgi:hypothetical protein